MTEPTARIITYGGRGDGLRFGVVRIVDETRRYCWDRLNDAVSLWIGAGDLSGDRDPDPDREAATLEALRGRP